jgi:hypothetical protein
MNGWLKRIITMLLVIVFISGATRLAWELLRPAVPALIALLVAFVVLRLVLRRPQGW